MEHDLMKNLNKEQLKAVMHKNGPLLIIAGAGTGKTTVVTQRIAYLIEQGKARPEEILALTFTEKAAGEMQERVDRLLPMGYLDLWISTFHGFGERILKDHGLDIGLSGDARLLNEFEQYALLKNNISKFELDYYRPLGNPNKFIGALIKHFSRLKDEDISPAQYLEFAGELRENMDSMLSGAKKGRKNPKSEALNSKQIQNTNDRISKHKSLKHLDLENLDLFRISGLEFSALTNKGIKLEKDEKGIIECEVNRINEVANAYHVYQQLLLEAGAMDFGDLINYCLKLFRERPAILKKYQTQFKYIMLDEFQDTNWAQYELIKMLTGEKNNLVVVGDDDQCLPGSSKVLTKKGEKRLDKIKIGEKVATAVGKGYLSYSRVDYINKSKKRARLLTFKTKSGHELTATDNHKMMCFIVPSQFANKKTQAKEKKFYYVYLMHKQELGWRLGITNNLSVRLKLERSADRIVAIQAYETEEEARYNELLLSLKYGIPTVCFMERGGVMEKKKWSEKLYDELDVSSGVDSLADDLGIDLDAHQVCLEAVNRGSKVRIKINIEMCHRHYRTKYAKGIFLQNPKVVHLLTIETSHWPTVKKLEKMGFKMLKGRGNGKRLRIMHQDLIYLGNIAKKIQKEIGGFIENRVKVGTNNIQHRKAVIIPASNVLPGMSFPVVTKKGVIYDQILKRKEENKIVTVYDLEVNRTHNFIANGIVVHNSVYKFRGASVSNILQFKKDYQDAEEVVLVKNYRNKQNILDLAYNFIQLNNPNRLEYALQKGREGSKEIEKPTPPDVTSGTPPPSTMLGAGKRGIREDGRRQNANKLSKKLKAENQGEGVIEVIEGKDLQEEMRMVVEKIADIKLGDKDLSWNDFAILVRANESAKEACAHLDAAGLPYIFLASRGLYAKGVIMDVVAYFKLLDSYHESPAVYRILNLEFFGFTEAELINFNFVARKKAWSLYTVLKDSRGKFGAATEKKIGAVLALIEKHTALARRRPASEIMIAFLNESGYLKYILDKQEGEAQEVLGYLNKFLKRIKEFEAASDEKSIKAFLEELTVEIESGEEGAVSPDAEAGPEAIKVMTIHAAKGLEFKHVFLTNMVDLRFPTTKRKEAIEIPDALVKEIVPAGDIHLEEERRLFYVAITRAGDGIYFSWAKDYGGARKKKPSRFLIEANLIKEGSVINSTPLNHKSQIINNKQITDSKKDNLSIYKLPSYFSYTQLAAFNNCPYQYRYAHILKVPRTSKHTFSFGQTMHTALQRIFQIAGEKGSLGQGSFDLTPSPSPSQERGVKEKGVKAKISWEEVKKIYEESWIDDWYESEAQKEEYRKLGLASLKGFLEKYKDYWPRTVSLEQGINLKVSGYKIFGKIDRIDEAENGGIQIVDYKTGQPKTGDKVGAEDKEQLLIYQLACEQVFEKKIANLQFYYLNDNSELNFVGTDKELRNMEEKILARIEGIKKAVEANSFPPKPGPLCKFCDFNSICEYRKL